MAVGSITSTLGAGSGIDIRQLVDNLVESQFAARTAQLDTRQETLTAQISAASELKSAITGFSTALSTLARGGSLATQPTSGDASVLKASLLSGGTASNLSASVEVRAIAQAQASHSARLSDATSAIGTGKFTLTFGNAAVSNGTMTGFTAGGGTPIEIEIGPDNASLNGIAAAINAKKAGITASVLNDGNGVRLVLKGATGESQSFTLTASDDSSGLDALNVGPGATGSTIGATAQDAVVVVDGVQLRRASNSITNIIPGVRLDLVSAKPGSTIQIGSQIPAEGLTQAVQDFVSTYNQLHTMLAAATDPQTGALRSDLGARTLRSQLSRLPSTILMPGATDGAPDTLAALGVATNRDGTLRVDTLRLSRVLAERPGDVEAMFKGGAGLPAALAGIATAAADQRSGLGASEANYAKLQQTLSEDREKAVTAAETTRTRMTQQFASMDARVAAYRSTQSFLEQQVDAWNNSNR
jgi:flagellar hook-associated protein 2